MTAPSSRCLLALLEWELGHPEEARGMFDELAADDFAALPRDSEWLFCLSVLAEVAAYLQDRDRAATLHRQLLPYASLNADAGGDIVIGSVARYLGLLATTMGHWNEVAQHFEDALAMNERMGARPWLAHTQHDYADAARPRRAWRPRTRPGAFPPGARDLPRSRHRAIRNEAPRVRRQRRLVGG